MPLTIRGYSGPISIKSRTDSGDEVQAVDVDGALPAGTNNIGDVDVDSLPGGAITPSDSLANPTTHGAVVSHGLEYDTQAGTWHRAGGGREIATASFLASAARTTSTTSTIVSTRGSRGFYLVFTVTSAPGSGGDLTLIPGTLSASGIVLGVTATRLTVQRSLGAVAWYFAAYPGSTEGVLATRTLITSCVALGPRFALFVQHSDSQSWTYSCELVLLP